MQPEHFPGGGDSAWYGFISPHDLFWMMAVAGDFNQDGFTDLYMPSSSGRDRNVLLLNEGRSDGVSFISADGGELGTMNSTDLYYESPYPEDWFYAAIDIDQDGDFDLIGMGYHVDSVSLYVNDGSAKFKRFNLHRSWDEQQKGGGSLLLAILTPMVIRISSLPHLKEGLTKSI